MFIEVVIAAHVQSRSYSFDSANADEENSPCAQGGLERPQRPPPGAPDVGSVPRSGQEGRRVVGFSGSDSGLSGKV